MEPKTDYGAQRTLLSILALVLLVYGLLGTLEINREPYTGYTISPDNVVTQVRAGSPAETAGLRAGDSVAQIDGRPVESVAAFFERGRPEIGSQGSVTVSRDGAAQTLAFTYAARPTADLLATSGINVLIGLSFLVLGLLVYRRRPTRLSRLLCALSLMLALLYLPGPFVASVVLRRVWTALVAFVVGVTLATLLYYCLNYPRGQAGLASRPLVGRAIFAVAPLVGLAIALVNLLAPTLTAANSMLLSSVAGVVYGGYVLLAIVAVVRSYLKASATERRATGLDLIVRGVLIGWGPLVVVILYHTLFPRAGDLPLERFWGVTAIALPIGLALALMRLEPEAPTQAKA